MSFKQVLQQDFKTAMKEKDTLRKNVITMVRAAILQKEKDEKIQMDDEAILEVIAKAAKQRRDSIPEFEKGNRPDMVKDLEKEVSILMSYLPKQLEEEEIDRIVSETIFEVGAQSAKDIGLVMKAIMPKVKGRADGRIVNQLVKKHLD